MEGFFIIAVTFAIIIVGGVTVTAIYDWFASNSEPSTWEHVVSRHEPQRKE